LQKQLLASKEGPEEPRDSEVALALFRTPSEQAKRDRNNEACRKCRLKKKETFAEMEHRVVVLETENSRLKAENSRLKENLQLANQLLLVAKRSLCPPAG